MKSGQIYTPYRHSFKGSRITLLIVFSLLFLRMAMNPYATNKDGTTKDTIHWLVGPEVNPDDGGAVQTFSFTRKEAATSSISNALESAHYRNAAKVKDSAATPN